MARIAYILLTHKDPEGIIAQARRLTAAGDFVSIHFDARAILELAGVGDILSKSLGSRAPLNVARATVDGLKNLRTFEEAARLRGITIKQMLA